MDGKIDALTGLAPLLRVRPQLQQLCRFGAQWTSRHDHEERGWAPFHVVSHGACLLDVGEEKGILLKAGDVAILPHGDPHTVRSPSIATGSEKPLQTVQRRHDNLLLKKNVDGPPDTKLICGRLRFEQAHDNMVLMALPAVILLRASGGTDARRLRTIVDMIQAELDEDRLGAYALAADLASALMVIVLRAHFESQPNSRGILAVLENRHTARVLAAILAEPARLWTLDGLAALAITSRATLVRLFQKTAGMAPLAFLAELRLAIARQRLLAGPAPLGLIAEEVGYQSETAFSRAYRRRYGIAPAADRKSESVQESANGRSAPVQGSADEARL